MTPFLISAALFFCCWQSSPESQMQGFSRHKIYSNSSLLIATVSGDNNAKQKNMSMQQNQKKIESLITQLSHRRNIRDVFTDLLDFAIFQLTISDNGKLTKNPIGEYKAEEKQKFIQLFQALGEAMDPFEDALGDIFMEYLSFGKNGQFFTPQNICDMMANMTIDKNKTYDKQPTVCDCACGSGRTLLAAAKVDRNFLLYGSDIDHTCVKMSVVNLAYNSLSGEIHWMNALTLEHYGSYRIEVCKITKLPYIITYGPDATLSSRTIKNTIAELPIEQRQAYVQGSLFDNL